MKTRYAIVGTGQRATMYTSAISGDFQDCAELVALCDPNQTRMDYHNRLRKERHGLPPVPTYKAADFDRMVAETHPDKVIVTSMDRTHHQYICRAMELGCDVVTEKPMTIDAPKCQEIIDTRRRTGRDITVTFNYRYAPRNTKVKALLQSGIAGEITTVHFEWLLDTIHGADYFRRWHRYKLNNGGLLVHKSTHHFDLVNWWLDSAPETVFAMADLKFYGRINAERRGVTEFYARSRGSSAAAKDPFAIHISPEKTPLLQALYYDAEHEDAYYRDQSVFSDGITTEDNMSVMVRYQNRAVMTYCLCAHTPWEGYRVCFNGTKGRLEFNVVERSFCNPGVDADFSAFGNAEVENTPGIGDGLDRKTLVPDIIFQPLWGMPRPVSYDSGSLAGHGGGDARMLRDVFRGAAPDPLGHAAGYLDGVHSIMTGIAANRSIETGAPVQIRDLVRLD